jgi:phosphohistidine phosphatase SixA
VSWLNLMIKNTLGSIAILFLFSCSGSQIPVTVVASTPAPEIPEIQAGIFGIHLFRHAEKITGSPDPGLTELGQARAEFIAQYLGSDPTSIRQVWSSDYARSRDTAMPLAEKLGVEIRLYDPRNLPALKEQLLQEKSDAVVIGHSNTTPELAAIMCDCEIKPMADTDYERGFFLVTGVGVNTITEFDMRMMWNDRPEE